MGAGQAEIVLQPNLALFWLKPRQKAVFELFLMPVSGCSPMNTGASSYAICSGLNQLESDLNSSRHAHRAMCGGSAASCAQWQRRAPPCHRGAGLVWRNNEGKRRAGCGLRQAQWRCAGARCAEGALQDILTNCPTERFCKLPGGEICVFGLSDASKMTQITSAEWRALLPSALPESPSTSQSLMSEPLLSGGLGLLAGVAIGLAVSHFRRRRH